MLNFYAGCLQNNTGCTIIELIFFKKGGVPYGRTGRGRDQTKKPHPCGANRFDVLRVGMDFKIKCQGCGHEIMLPRAKIERNIKKVLRTGEQ